MRAVRAFGFLCIAAGILIFLTPQIREVRLQWELKKLQRAEVTEEVLDESSEKPGEKTEESSEKYAETCKNTEESCGAGAETREDLYAQMEEYNRKLYEEGQILTGSEDYERNPIGEDGVIGSVRIPDMNVELPLYLGATYEHLDKGAAVLGGTSMPIGGVNTNCVISGHRSWCGAPYFRDIELLKAGSEVIIDNGRETLYYRVFEKRIILPDDTEAVMIQPGKDLVTLITCHPYLGGGTHRYVVYCERMEKEEEEIMDEGKSQQSTWAREEERPQENAGIKRLRMEKKLRLAAACLIIAAALASVLSKREKNRQK